MMIFRSYGQIAFSMTRQAIQKRNMIRTFMEVCAYFSSAPEEYQAIEKAVKDALTANQRGYDAVCKMPRKDGSSIWIRFIGTFTNESIDGVPVIYVVYTDVNDLVNARTKVEKEHSKSQNMLRKELQTMECLKRIYGCMDMAE